MRTPPPAARPPLTFAEWWNAAGDWVEAPNQRRQGWSGMMRVRAGDRLFYVKKQCNHLYFSAKPPFRHPTVSREHENIVRLHALGVRVPSPVFHGTRYSAQGLEGILVTEELEGFFSLDAQTTLTPEQKKQHSLLPSAR